MDNFFARANKIVGVIWQLAASYPDNLKEKIQNHSLYFISQLSFQNWQEAQKALISLKNLLSLANYIGSLRLVNFEILNQEIKKLENQIKEFEKATKKQKEEVDLREVFSFEDEESEKFALEEISSQEIEKALENNFLEPEKAKSNLSANNKKEEIFRDLTFRQKQIVDLLSSKKEPLQSVEISKAFPAYSERTIRNELSTLCQRNILKKQGAGRKVFYSLNEELLRV